MKELIIQSYEEAAKNAARANTELVVALFDECCPDGTNPYVMDEDGHWMTKEEVIQKMLEIE